jgi:hypothetical protein
MRRITPLIFRRLLILALLLAAFPATGIQASSFSGMPVAVWGSKPVLAHLLLNQEWVNQLQADLDLTQIQRSYILDIARQEETQIGRLEAESLAIIGDPQLTRLQKAQWVAQSGYNQRILAILRQNQQSLHDSLGIETYRRLVDWIQERWADEWQANSPPAGNKKVLAALAGAKLKVYPRSFEVYATRYDAGDRKIVALPDKCLKFANGGALRCDGYAFGQSYSVAISYGSKMVVALVGESGPWNVDDNYWSKTSDPQPRRMFADLQVGLPEAQAAYFNGYNGGVDQFGRLVTSPVAIDVSRALAADLGLPAGNNKVTVSFLWTEGWDGSQAQPGVGTTLPPAGGVVIKWQTSTPNPDGSIVHIVQAGQTLVGIATVYQLSLEDLLEMNGLTMQSIIQPEDRILVKRANLTPTAMASATPTLTATATIRPSLSPLPSRLATQALPLTETLSMPAQARTQGKDYLLFAILFVVLAGLVLLAWGVLIQRKK